MLAANLHAGGNPSCARCKVAFATAPDLVDPARASAHVCTAVRLDRGASDRIVTNAVHIAQTIGRAPELAAEIDALIEASGERADLDRLRRARARIGRSGR